MFTSWCRFTGLELQIIRLFDREEYGFMENGRKTICWWHIVLLVLTLLAAAAKILIGFDRDEAYIVVMGVRLLEGDRLFDTMWELHMTSAWPAFLGLYLFRTATGSLEGAVIFLRILSTVIQFAAAWLAYRILRRYESRDTAVLAAFFVANFLPRATQNLEYGLLEMLFVLTAMLLLYDEWMKMGRGEKVCLWKIVAAAVSYSLGVLAYPTIIISFPAILAAMVLLQEKGTRRLRLPVLFCAVCAVCALIFFGSVLSYLPMPEFLSNLQGILADGTHTDTVKTATYFAQLLELCKRTSMIALGALVCVLFFYKWERRRELFWYCLLLSGAVIFIGFNVTGIRPSGAIGLQVRYMIAAVLAVVFAIRLRERMITGLFVIPGIFVYAGAMIGSNMGFEENASFLYLTVFAAILLMGRYAHNEGDARNAGDARGEKMFCGIGMLCMAAFLCGIIFGKGCLVRITGTAPANIAQERTRMQGGILKGVYVYPEEADKYAEKEREIQAYSDAEDVVLYLGADAVCNTFAEGDFTSATCISTPAYNEEWVLYYENESHPRPTVVFLDRDLMKSFADFQKTEFGRYFAERCGVTEEDIIEENMFFIFRL